MVVAEPRDAATVMLVCDGVHGIEVWMMRRQAAMAFAPEAWVFPGGAVTGRPTSSEDLGWPALPDDLVQRVGVDPQRCASILEAAVRELFEEADVVLARDVDGSPVAPWNADVRAALLSDRMTLADLLADASATAALDALLPWDRWLTPERSPRRYDTWFFLCDARPWSSPEHVMDGEATESGWRRPADVLADHADGDAILLPPTFAVLERLTHHPDVASALLDDVGILQQHSG